MPMIETTTIRVTPAAAPARCTFRADAVKNAVACSSSGEGPVAASMMVSTPTSAASRPSPLTTSTPLERAIGTTSCPRCSRISTRCDPTRPVAPVTAIFWLLSSVCIVPPVAGLHGLLRPKSQPLKPHPVQDRHGWRVGAFLILARLDTADTAFLMMAQNLRAAVIARDELVRPYMDR